MSQPINSVSKYSRSVGEKLFLKGERDEGPKNAFTRRPYGPGQHGQAKKRKPSDYGRQLTEKQKARYIYGLSEKQLRKTFELASRSKENTGEKLLQLLELRADNVLARGGLASNRRQARQIISHGNVLLNSKKIKTPSIILKPGDSLELKKVIKTSDTVKKETEAPGWLEVDKKNNIIKIVSVPSRGQIQTTLEEQLIVEYYSRLT